MMGEGDVYHLDYKKEPIYHGMVGYNNVGWEGVVGRFRGSQAAQIISPV